MKSETVGGTLEAIIGGIMFGANVAVVSDATFPIINYIAMGFTAGLTAEGITLAITKKPLTTHLYEKLTSLYGRVKA